MTECRIGLQDITLPDLLDVKSLLEVHKICAPLRSIFDEPSRSTPTRQAFTPLLRSDRNGQFGRPWTQPQGNPWQTGRFHV